MNAFADEFARLADEHGAGDEAQAVLRRWNLATALPGMITTLGKMELPGAVTEPARLALTTPGLLATNLHPGRLTIYGLVGVLATDGSPDSVAGLEAHLAEVRALTDEEARFQLLKGTHRILTALATSSEATELAGRLGEELRELQGLSEASAWAEQHAPKLQGDWKVDIWLSTDRKAVSFGAGQTGVRIRLVINPAHSPDWRVTMKEPHGGGTYEAWPGNVGQRGWELPALDTLADFPAWVRQVSQVLEVEFPEEHIDVRAGRLRSVAGAAVTWIKG